MANKCYKAFSGECILNSLLEWGMGTACTVPHIVLTFYLIAAADLMCPTLLMNRRITISGVTSKMEFTYFLHKIPISYIAAIFLLIRSFTWFVTWYLRIAGGNGQHTILWQIMRKGLPWSSGLWQSGGQELVSNNTIKMTQMFCVSCKYVRKKQQQHNSLV